ncbi:MAG TPA: S53 family peptidase [Sporichthyaceae bacterium]
MARYARPLGSTRLPRAVRVGAVLAVLAAGTTVLSTPGAMAATSASGPTSAANCAKADKGYAACLSRHRTDIKGRKGRLAPSITPSGWAPNDLKSAYSIPPNLGAGSTIAIVDAYDDPNAEADLALYRSQYALPACTTAGGCFRKVSQTGSTTALPRANSGWAGEIALDMEMVSAVCPACHILLVEASSNSDANLGTAENYAASQPGVKAISNSWGGSESSSDPSLTSNYLNHPGIAITASTGDDGYGTEWPASAPAVVAVGGTSLSRSSNARGWSETAWSGAGSGCSSYEAKPSWQHDSGCAKRTIADVSAIADPNTGVAVYDSYGSGGWAVYGGTSVASPIIAGMYALANATSASSLYSAATGLNDVTSGQNKSSCSNYLCKAVVGYDGPTGVGTPSGLLAIGGSGGGTSSNTFSVAVNPTGGSLTAGTGTTATVNTTTTGGSAQTMTLSASGAPAGVNVSFGPSSLTSGSSSTMTVTTSASTTPGTYTIAVTGTGSSSSATGTYALTISAPSSGGCVTGQQLTNTGFESGSTSWTATSGVIGKNTGTSAPHSGVYDAWLDGYGRSHTDTLAQTANIPSGCTTVTVSFWTKISTQETTSSAVDKLVVALGSTTLGTLSNLNKSSGWVQYTFTTTVPAGTTSAALKFTGTENSSRYTSFLVDDTSLTVS